MGGKSRKGGYVPKNLMKRLTEMKKKQQDINDYVKNEKKNKRGSRG